MEHCFDVGGGFVQATEVVIRRTNALSGTSRFYRVVNSSKPSE